MNKIWIIIQREYMTRVTRPAFWIATLLAPVGFLVLMVSSVLISTYNSESSNVAIVDESGIFHQYFKDHGIADAEDGSVHFFVVDNKYNTLATQTKQQGKEARYDAIVLIPTNYNLDNPSNPVIACNYVERPGVIKKQIIEQRINEVVQKLRLQNLNISEETQEMLDKKTDIVFASLIDEKEKKGYADAAAIVGIIMGFAIYISLFFYGTMIMKGVQEEKTNRIVEVLTSSVKPFQLLMGKIAGIGAVGLTQFILWITLIFITNLVLVPVLGISMASSPSAVGAMQSGNEIDPDTAASIVQSLSDLPLSQIAILFPLFFLGGFLIYGSLFAALGAAMGEDSDQQSLMIPVTIPIIISIFIAMNVINNPDSSLGFWGSIFPLTSPIVMCTLLPFKPDWWQLALSLVLLVAGFAGSTYIAARIYRVGILMYGKKITLREIARWIFTKQ